MNPLALKGMSLDQLLKRFVDFALEQDRGLLQGDITRVNKLGEALHAISTEMKSREGDQRRILLRLYDHPNIEVRLAAAKATVAVAPEMARRAIQTIAESGEYPQAGDAGMALRSIDQGTFKPT
jgi:Domain of unknown function (DUF2019)